MAPEPVLSLSVVSHGQGQLVHLLLEDLRACLSGADEVLLTINIPERLPLFPNAYPFRLRVLENEAPKGYGANHNAAFRRARGRQFCVLNPDIRIDANPFPVLLACIDADPLVAACAPLIVSPGGAIEDSVRRFPTPWNILRKALGSSACADYVFSDGTLYPDWIAGMFMLFRSEAFAAGKGFDERYFLYYEDVDLCARLRLSGWRIAACPEARAVHDARRQSRRSLRYMCWHASSMLRFFVSPVHRRLRRTRSESLS